MCECNKGLLPKINKCKMINHKNVSKMRYQHTPDLKGILLLFFFKFSTFPFVLT